MLRSFLFAGAVAVSCFGGSAWAAPSAEQKKEVADLQLAIKRAGNLFVSKKYKESADAVKQVQEGVEKLAGASDKEVHALLEPIFESLEKAHGLLELEGYTLPPLKKLADIPAVAPMPKATPATPAKPGTPSATPLPVGAVSFTKNIAPLLITKCGNCHVNQSKGGFSAASYEVLMKGTPKAAVIVPPGNGNAGGGILLDLIESGDMPRGGGKVTPAELAMLKKWITEGCKFDGTDPKGNITALAANVKPAEPVKVTVEMATGKEGVLFSRDIAGVLAENCLGCHGDQNPRQNLSLSTFARLIKGGDSGAPVIPGKPAESLLVRKLKGTAGKRMPEDKPPLADDVIAKIEKWVTDGAKFDGSNQELEMAQLAAVAKAKMATHEELAAERAKAAVKNWTTAHPDITPVQTSSDHFVVVGNVSEEVLAEIGKQAEAVVPKLTAALKHPAGQPLVKGKLTLFVCKKRFDYTEFTQMVEKRQTPPGVFGHWAYTTVDAYGCITYPENQPAVLPALVAQQVAGVYFASLGGSPHWFAEGMARATVAKMEPKDPRVALWAPEISGALGSMSKPDEFMSGKMNEEAANLVAFAFCESLLGQQTKFNTLLSRMRGGDSFSSAFPAAYGAPPEAVAAAWAARGGKK